MEIEENIAFNLKWIVKGNQCAKWCRHAKCCSAVWGRSPKPMKQCVQPELQITLSPKTQHRLEAVKPDVRSRRPVSILTRSVAVSANFAFFKLHMVWWACYLCETPHACLHKKTTVPEKCRVFVWDNIVKRGTLRGNSFPTNQTVNALSALLERSLNFSVVSTEHMQERRKHSFQGEAISD